MGFLRYVWVCTGSTDNRCLHVSECTHTNSHAVVPPPVYFKRTSDGCTTFTELSSFSSLPWLLSPDYLIIRVNWRHEKDSITVEYIFTLSTGNRYWYFLNMWGLQFKEGLNQDGIKKNCQTRQMVWALKLSSKLNAQCWPWGGICKDRFFSLWMNDLFHHSH